MSTSRTSDAPTGSDLAPLVRRAAERLAASGVPSADVDAELLAAHVLGIGRGELAAAMMRGDRMPEAAATRLSERKLAVWSGDYYALEVMQQLGLPDGAVRVGLVHYNTEQEVDRLLEGLAEL